MHLKIISQNIQNIHANKYQTAGQFLIFYELIEMLQRKLYKTEIILEIDVCCENLYKNMVVANHVVELVIVSVT